VPPFLGRRQVDMFNTQLASARSEIPSALGTMPSSFKHWKQFKAKEWQAVIKILGPPMLEGNLPADALANFLDLREIWLLGTQFNITQEQISALELLAQKFVTNFERLYYQEQPSRINVCLVNNHLLLHLARLIRYISPARYWWSFAMERYCFTARQEATAPSQLTKSMFNGLIRQEQNNSIALKRKLQSFRKEPPLQLEFCKPLNPIARARRKKPPFDQVPLSSYYERALSAKLEIRHQDRAYSLQYYGRCLLASGLTIGSQASQYSHHRSSHFVCFKTETGPLAFGTVLCFISITNPSRQYAVTRSWSHIRLYPPSYATYETRKGKVTLVDISMILCLVGVMQERDLLDPRRRQNMIVGTPPEAFTAAVGIATNRPRYSRPIQSSVVC
jgi:hypothetical protein